MSLDIQTYPIQVGLEWSQHHCPSCSFMYTWAVVRWTWMSLEFFFFFFPIFCWIELYGIVLPLMCFSFYDKAFAPNMKRLSHRKNLFTFLSRFHIKAVTTYTDLNPTSKENADNRCLGRHGTITHYPNWFHMLIWRILNQDECIQKE